MKTEGPNFRGDRGFSLVLVLILILLCTAVVVALNTMVTVESRNQTSSRYLHDARQNALLGLDEALAALQIAAGPDQRVTATGEILGSDVKGGAKYWTGVWDNRITDGSTNLPDNPLKYGSNRDGEGKLTTKPTWLVSATPGSVPDPTDIPGSLGGSTNTVTLVAPTIAGEGDQVEAGKVPIARKVGASDKTVGHFAWWVGDEGVKANLALHDRQSTFDPTSDKQKSLLNSVQLQTAQIADPRHFTSTGSTSNLIPVNDGMLDYMKASQDFLSIAGLTGASQGPDQAWLRQNRHSFTAVSLGLQTDVRDGGLKLDLSRGLEEQWPSFTEYLRTEKDLMPSDSAFSGTGTFMVPLFKALAPSGGPSGATSHIYGPYWDLLYSYYQTNKPFQPYVPNARTYQISSRNYSSFHGYISGRIPAPPNGAPTEDDSYAARHNVVDTPVSGGYRGTEWLSNNWVTGTRPGLPEFRITNTPASSYYSLLPVYRNPSAAANLTMRGDPFQNAVSPIMLKYQVNIGISKHANGKYLVLSLYPQYVLWNPYNTELRPRIYAIEGTVSFPIQIKVTNPANPNLLDTVFQAGKSVENNSAKGVRSGEADGLPGTGVDFSRLFFMNGSSYCRQSYGFRFTTVATGFKPGEARVFTLPAAAEFHADHTDGRETIKENKQGTFFLRSDSYTNDKRVYINLTKVALNGVGDPGVKDDNLKWNPVPELKPTDEVTLVIYAGTAITNAFPSASVSSDTASQLKFNLSPFMFDTRNVLGRVYLPGGGVAYPLKKGLFPLDGETSADYPKEIPLGPVSTLSTSTPKIIMSYSWQLKPFGTSNAPAFSVYNPRSLSPKDTLLPVDRNLTDIYEFRDGGTSASETDIQLIQDTSPKRPFLGESYDTGGQKNLVLYENPVLPPTSIGDFMHANVSLTHQYPNYAIGSSWSSPYVPLDGYSGNVPTIPSSVTRVPDISYLLNTSLFDAYFLSSVPPDPTGLDSNIYPQTLKDAMADLPPFEPVDVAYVDADKPLPNSRMSYLKKAGEGTTKFLSKLRDFKTAASKVAVKGSFNINSTSVPAWKAFLAGSARGDVAGSALTFPSTTNGTVTIDKSDGAIFPRFSRPVGDAGDEWVGVRRLSGAELTELATKIVEQVKIRGPFLSLADFVNRRLTSGTTGKSGALQSAIEDAKLNDSDDLGDVITDIPVGGDHASNLAAGYGAPGTLLQNDILRSLAPAMTARSDTFVVRFFGDAANPSSGKLEARAYGEAVVQRLPEYVDESDPPETASNDLVANGINQTLGRRFKVVSFRWLSEDEI